MQVALKSRAGLGPCGGAGSRGRGLGQAAQALGGEHVSKYCKAISAEGKPTHRFVERLTVEEIEGLAKLVRLILRITPFLHSMFLIVNTLVEIGGAGLLRWIDEVLAAQN